MEKLLITNFNYKDFGGQIKKSVPLGLFWRR